MASPDRPFVPHRTPKTARPVMNATEFRLARPFVAGAENVSPEIVQAAPIAAARPESAPAFQPRAESGPALQPIEDFLHRPMQSAPPVAPESTVDDFPSDFDEDSGELPPVNIFSIPCLQVEDFVPEAQSFRRGARPSPKTLPASQRLEPRGGGQTDWQQCDWRSLAALGEGGESAASNDWATTDWDEAAPLRTRREGCAANGAQAIVRARSDRAEDQEWELSAGEHDPRRWRRRSRPFTSRT